MDAAPSPDGRAGQDAGAVPDAESRLDMGLADLGNVLDMGVPPLDQGPQDADPRSNADLWVPDLGAPPDDMPAEIRWMHGRMWCDAPRPPRVLPDGTSECDYVNTPTPEENQVGEPAACRAWPYRDTEGGLAGSEGIDAYIGCNADLSVCCTFYTYEEFVARPCGWSHLGIAGEGQSVLPPEMEDALPWLEANGLRAIVPVYTPNVGLTPELVAAWQGALNNCHPICKRPACGP